MCSRQINEFSMIDPIHQTSIERAAMAKRRSQSSIKHEATFLHLGISTSEMFVPLGAKVKLCKTYLLSESDY